MDRLVSAANPPEIAHVRMPVHFTCMLCSFCWLLCNETGLHSPHCLFSFTLNNSSVFYTFWLWCQSFCLCYLQNNFNLPDAPLHMCLVLLVCHHLFDHRWSSHRKTASQSWRVDVLETRKNSWKWGRTSSGKWKRRRRALRGFWKKLAQTCRRKPKPTWWICTKTTWKKFGRYRLTQRLLSCYLWLALCNFHYTLITFWYNKIWRNHIITHAMHEHVQLFRAPEISKSYQATWWQLIKEWC